MDNRRDLRVGEHPILPPRGGRFVQIFVDGEPFQAIEGESIVAALMAAGRMVLRYTARFHEPRGVHCAVGRCTDCMMVVDGQPNVRTCVTPVREGMRVETQRGLGYWGESKR